MLNGTEGQEQDTLHGKNKANNAVKSCTTTRYMAIQAVGRRKLKGISTQAEGDHIYGKG